MTPEEMQTVIAKCSWVSICTVSPDGKPYAIEATPFVMPSAAQDTVCFMINPRGGTWKNLQTNPHVLLKYTFTHGGLHHWAGVSCFGTGEFVNNADAIREGYRVLGEMLGQDYSGAGEKFARITERTPLLQVRVLEVTGRCSAPKDAPFEPFLGD